MSAIVGIVAGRGIFGYNIPVFWRYLRDRSVLKLFIAVDSNKPLDDQICSHHKTQLVQWEGADTHDNLAVQRNNMLDLIHQYIHPRPRDNSPVKLPDWVIIGDDDGLPSDNYFQILDKNLYSYPVIATGKLQNLDGQRYWDIANHYSNRLPQLLPYESWWREEYKKGFYINGNQHIMNSRAFNLGVRYRNHPGEDTWWAEDNLKAGAQFVFMLNIYMTLQRMHGKLGSYTFGDCERQTIEINNFSLLEP